jgi:hypothetical protein
MVGEMTSSVMWRHVWIVCLNTALILRGIGKVCAIQNVSGDSFMILLGCSPGAVNVAIWSVLLVGVVSDFRWFAGARLCNVGLHAVLLVLAAGGMLFGFFGWFGYSSESQIGFMFVGIQAAPLTIVNWFAYRFADGDSSRRLQRSDRRASLPTAE